MLWFFVVRNHYDRDLLSLKCFGFNLFVMINVLKKLFSDTERFSLFFFLCIVFCSFIYVCMQMSVFLWVYWYVCSVSCIETFSYSLFELIERFLIDQFFVAKPMFRRFGLPNNGYTVLNDFSLSILQLRWYILK